MSQQKEEQLKKEYIAPISEDEHPCDTVDDWAFETQAIRSGVITSNQQEHSEALYLTSSYAYDSAAQAQGTFSGEIEGNVYSRYTNPSVRMFEKRMAVLEKGDDACATASGMSALAGTCMALLKAGDHVVCSRSVFGTTVTLFNNYLQKFGIETTFVDLTDISQWRDAVRPETRMLFLETPSNPLGDVADLSLLSTLAKESEVLLVVDNCFCTPALQQPLTLGADIVVHSATKYIDGQGRCIGGVVVGREPLMTEVHLWQRAVGASMSPFNAWVFNKGLETLALRMEAHCKNAMGLAEWLNEHQKIEKVHYCGLESHPGYELAKRQQKGFGGVLSFQVKGGREEAWMLMDRVQVMSRTANLGDTRTIITHPATTTHCRLSDEDKQRAGVTENLVRIAVGLEHLDDLKKDLDRGLSGNN